MLRAGYMYFIRVLIGSLNSVYFVIGLRGYFGFGFSTLGSRLY